MKWIALYMPATENNDPSQGGFDSEQKAWDWVTDNGMCKFCTEEYNKDPEEGITLVWQNGM